MAHGPLHCCTWAFPSCREQALTTLASLVGHRVRCLRLASSVAGSVQALGSRGQQLWHMGLVALRHVESSRTRD